MVQGRLTSPVVGVTYNAQRGNWIVTTLARWGVKQRYLVSVSLQEEAEDIANTYFPSLELAVADGNFERELAAVKADLKARCDVRDL